MMVTAVVYGMCLELYANQRRMILEKRSALEVSVQLNRCICIHVGQA